jgi:hypothetical protein
MVHRISSILSRFPENEKAVAALIHASGELDALCQEYADAGQALDHLTNEAVANALQKRRLAVEEEILTRIEGYKPA